jgi:multimeric flavodoxin WrbA
MKYTVLMGSPRKKGNTFSILDPFIEKIKETENEIELFWLYDMNIHGCIACRNCQKDWTKFGCVFKDDMQMIFDSILLSDYIILATPIYSWSCTAPMKAVLDRLVYGMNKYYGDKTGPSLWSGKHVAIITTCGYRPEKGADLFEESIRRYCKHSSLIYDGMLAERDLGYNTKFIDEEKKEHAKTFAIELMK